MSESNKEIEPQGKPRMLIVEDDKITLGILRMTVKLHDVFDAVYAESVSDALKMLREAKEKGNPYALVFSDLGLTDNLVDGGFKIAEITRAERLARTFILYTGRAGDIALKYKPEQLEEMGIDKLLGKPASAETLEKSLDWAKEAIDKKTRPVL